MIGLVKADGLNFLRENLSHTSNAFSKEERMTISVGKSFFFLILTVKRKKDNSDVESVH